MAPTKSKPKKEPFVIRSLTLTPALETLLHTIGQEASDALGWTVSDSAVVRAVLRYVAQQPPAWRRSVLLLLIEQEIAAGRVWGSKKK